MQRCNSYIYCPFLPLSFHIFAICSSCLWVTVVNDCPSCILHLPSWIARRPSSIFHRHRRRLVLLLPLSRSHWRPPSNSPRDRRLPRPARRSYFARRWTLSTLLLSTCTSTCTCTSTSTSTAWCSVLGACTCLTHDSLLTLAHFVWLSTLYTICH